MATFLSWITFPNQIPFTKLAALEQANFSWSHSYHGMKFPNQFPFTKLATLEQVNFSWSHSYHGIKFPNQFPFTKLQVASPPSGISFDIMFLSGGPSNVLHVIIGDAVTPREQIPVFFF